jgi:FAD/FMN-containing dehydrogenase
MTYAKRDVTSWGRVVSNKQWVASPQFRVELADLLTSRTGESVLAAGLHRSYGDCSLNRDGSLIAMTRLDRLMNFEPQSGHLRAEAGISFDKILRFIVPHGFFIPVTPGTRYITLGGAIANDIHGKNHHRMGTIGRHVTRLGLLRSEGGRIEATPTENSELFAATVGGLGLTGIIEWVEIALTSIRSSFLKVEATAFGSLDEFWDLADRYALAQEHTVAWIDCAGSAAGRGIFSGADWLSDGELLAHRQHHPVRLPFSAPSWLLNKTSVQAFNTLYYAIQKHRAGRSRRHYCPVFYPLDAIGGWNRLYGSKGFWQYQCVLPTRTMRDAIAALIMCISRNGQGSFLSVLKTFGDAVSPGLLSFPMQGATFALDFPNCGARTEDLFARLDDIVREAGGRIYPAKDARMPGAMWRAGYPALDRFSKYVDPHFNSDFWRRVEQ